MNKLHLAIDQRHAGYITPSLARTLERAARCTTLDQAESVLRAGATTWWLVARTSTAVAVSHIWQGRQPILCAQVDYALAVVSLSLLFFAAAGIVRALMAPNLSRLPPHTRRNALTYALHAVTRDEQMLAEQLEIPVSELLDYLQGKQEVPIPVVRKAIRLVLQETQADNVTQREVLQKIRELNGKP